MSKKRIVVWADMTDPAIVYPCDKFPDKPTNKYPELIDKRIKEDLFRNYEKCELVPLKVKKRKESK